MQMTLTLTAPTGDRLTACVNGAHVTIEDHLGRQVVFASASRWQPQAPGLADDHLELLDTFALLQATLTTTFAARVTHAGREDRG